MHVFIERNMKMYENCVYCLDGELKMITPFHHSTEHERVREIQKLH